MPSLLLLAEHTHPIHTPWTHPWMWGGFVLFLFVALAVDLLAHRRSSRAISTKVALAWSLVWASLALGFAGLLLVTAGRQSAADFLTGYLTEESLSVDNLFVFVLVFSYFRIPPQHQHRVLMWGILGAMVMRAAMILLGAELVTRFHYTLAFFGLFLLYTGVKLLFHDDDEADPSKSKILQFARRVLPMAKEAQPGASSASGEHRPITDVASSSSARLGDPSASGRHRLRRATAFFVKEDGRWKVTNYFLVLVVIEISDVVFAVDSVPAIFGAISTPPDPFIVFTSNMFAILGLRTLYFVIAAAIQHLRYLKYGLSLVLCFIGLKMLLPFAHELIQHAWQVDIAFRPFDAKMHLPSELSLLVVGGILVATAAISLLHKPAVEAPAATPAAGPAPVAAPPTAPPAERPSPGAQP